MQAPTPISNQETYLSVLTSAPPNEMKEFVEALLVRLPTVEVLSNRTGLAMLPYQDNAKGAIFHLGEVLITEAHIKVAGQEGYAACLGRDMEQAIGIAILDALLQSQQTTLRSFQHETLRFVANQAEMRQERDDELLRKVATTRVELETF